MSETFGVDPGHETELKLNDLCPGRTWQALFLMPLFSARLTKAESLSASRGQAASGGPAGTGNRPNPSNPMEYCSTVSPMLQVRS